MCRFAGRSETGTSNPNGRMTSHLVVIVSLDCILVLGAFSDTLYFCHNPESHVFLHIHTNLVLRSELD